MGFVAGGLCFGNDVYTNPGNENAVRNRFQQPTSLIDCCVLSRGVA